MCAILLLLFLNIPWQTHQLYFETYFNEPTQSKSGNKMINLLDLEDSVTTENNRAMWAINQQLLGEEDDDNNRNAIKMEKFKWPMDVVPYCFDDSFGKKMYMFLCDY